ncbi:uncharacterized protein LOC106641279 [Copidosoma floridanum]|uniref:uncharacterized protein LOC106641279 n=1 Tax=Copidosoma floridanum TaxID=29053 RepID=UPI0006C9CCC3|nr:uncharacterized protein LOC106641279 [Copidosoma floridanum]
MEIEELNEAVNDLKNAISQFPVGVNKLDDYMPVEEKIINLRNELKAIDARCLTLNAITDMGMSDELPQGDLNKALENLNFNTTTYLINTKTLSQCLQSKAIQEIIYNDAGTKEIQSKIKICLSKLFLFNDKLLAKDETIKELKKKQYLLKLDCHNAIYDYQDFLKEKETRRNKKLKETHPDFIYNKEKIDRTISKINTMKKLITNLIASMSKELDEKEELVELLEKHKGLVNLEKITDMALNQSV